jgi:hypothetical protein
MTNVSAEPINPLQDPLRLTPDQSAQLIERITRVTSFLDEDPLGSLLQILERLPLIKLASVWKIKRRSAHLCAKARTREFYDPDPTDPTYHSEYVFPLAGSILDTIVNSPRFRANHTVVVDDVSSLKNRPFFPEIKLALALYFAKSGHHTSRFSQEGYGKQSLLLYDHLHRAWLRGYEYQ